MIRFGKRANWGERMGWQIVIPVITLVVGLVGGFFIGVYYLRKQIENMQNNPDMIREMAKKMGYNINNQQMNRVQQAMKKQKFK